MKTTLIKTIRSKLGMTQAEFATLSGLSQSAISRAEQEGGNPTLDTLRKIRAGAIERGLPWEDGWIFDPPPAEEAEAAGAPQSDQGAQAA